MRNSMDKASSYLREQGSDDLLMEYVLVQVILNYQDIRGIKDLILETACVNSY